MEGEKKISFLTPGQVKAYRMWLVFLMILTSGATLLLAYLSILNRTFYNFTIVLFLVFALYRIYKGVKSVEFDRQFLYVTESGYDILVPMDNIKKVEIKNLGGIYKVIFFDAIQSGTFVLFKPSLIYPLDFKKQDEKVNILRAYAWKARQNRAPLPKNALTS